jgi:hypothetical protein
MFRIIIQNCRRISSKETPLFDKVVRNQSDAFEIISSNIPSKIKASMIDNIINDKQATIEKNELKYAKFQSTNDDLILELNSKYEKEAFARAFLEKSLSVRKLIGIFSNLT